MSLRTLASAGASLSVVCEEWAQPGAWVGVVTIRCPAMWDGRGAGWVPTWGDVASQGCGSGRGRWESHLSTAFAG